MHSTVAADMRAGYTALDAWIYDALIAPAVADVSVPLLSELLPRVSQGGSLLDVGCGGGQLAMAAVRQRPDLLITGIDQSSPQVARARRRASHLGKRLSFLEATADALPFPPESFDAVLSNLSIKHWPDQARGLRECVRVLKPGGTLFITEIDRGCRLEAARDFVATWRFPRLMQPLVLGIFRTFGAGQSLDLEDAQALLEQLPIAGRETWRVTGTMILVMRATK